MKEFDLKTFEIPLRRLYRYVFSIGTEDHRNSGAPIWPSLTDGH